jgi:hypothetical protein
MLDEVFCLLAYTAVLYEKSPDVSEENRASIIRVLYA